MQKTGGAGGGVAPTGCFKCGRPGHWSRDCPSSSATNPSSDPKPGSFPSKFPHGTTQPLENGKPVDKAASTKKAPSIRPKLTPELLLSDDGLGFVLRHFPRSFKYHGRGHEANDLGNLISLYAQWHSHLIPYYSFNQFIRKVEQVGATRRVRTCLRELRDRVANGGDPTKFHEPPTEQLDPDCEPETMDIENPVHDLEDPPMNGRDAGDVQEDMFDEIYRNATEETPSVHGEPCTDQSTAAPEIIPLQNSMAETLCPGASDSIGPSSKVEITEEQSARMEANRLKALERAAARARALQAS